MIQVYEHANIAELDFQSKRIYRVEYIYEPHVYVIKEAKSQRLYIGCRTAQSCRINDVGSRYFTSSAIIKDNWKQDLNSFAVLCVIPCISNHDAMALEIDLIASHNAVASDQYMNLGHPRVGFCSSGKPFTEDHRSNLSTALKNAHFYRSDADKAVWRSRLSISSKLKFLSQSERDKVRDGIYRYHKCINYDFSGKSTRIKHLHQTGHYKPAYRKISEANKGQSKPEGFGDKVRQARLGMKFSDEWRSNISQSRKGKARGDRNAMSSEANRNKVSASKVGRKRVYLANGKFLYVRAEDLYKYYKHTNGKYYEYEE